MKNDLKNKRVVRRLTFGLGEGMEILFFVFLLCG